MRINLNFKDATITRISPSEFRVVFDLSKMIKPRLSVDARMYIEHFNLPEFVDDKWGKEIGNLYGYFELRGDNIDSNDFDSEYGNTGNTILYTSPLHNFGTFTNNDPMFISNFKINQNFLRDRLAFTLKIYDKNGDPFVRSITRTEEVNTTTAEYATYLTKVNELSTLNTELEDAKNTLIVMQTRVEQQKKQKNALYATFLDKQKVLFDKIVKSLAKRNLGVSNRIKLITLKALLEVESVNSFLYIFELFLPGKISIGTQPYKDLSFDLNAFYTAWFYYTSKLFQIGQSEANIINIDSTDTGIWYETQTSFDPANISVKSESQQDIDYEVTVPGGTNKTGQISINYFHSPIHSITTNIVQNVKPSTGSDHELADGDVLVLDNTEFESSMAPTFEYFFTKTENGRPPGIEISANVSASRFSLKVTRNGSTYTHEFTNDVPTKGLADADFITVKGSALGGVDGTNDLVITINATFVPLTTQTYTFNDYQDVVHTENGIISRLEIVRDNTAKTYTLTSSDFTNTKKYNVGDTIVIPGDLLDGENKTNDCAINVDLVIVPEIIYNLDDTKINHSIPSVKIDSNNSTVVNGSGVANTAAKDWGFYISSQNGTYVIETDRLSGLGTSEGFAQDDRIIIKGSVLTGEDGAPVTDGNDVTVHVQSVVGTGKIETIDIDSTIASKARNISSFKLDVKVKANDTNYEVVPVSGQGFAVGDILGIDGGDVGGTTGQNDIKLRIKEVKVNDAKKNVVEKLEFLAASQPAAPETGEIGQIKAVKLSGTAKQFVADGSWLQSDTVITSGTPIDITTISMPDMKITLSKVLPKGIKQIDNEITAKYTEISDAKTALTSTNKTYILDLNDQLDKLKCMNMSMVLYDEIPEYTQASSDAIKGNTYSRLNGCQFKRI